VKYSLIHFSMKVTLTFILNFILYLTAVSQSKHDQLEQIMKKYHAFNMFEGSVLVAEQGKVVYKGAFGLANREWSIANTTDTKFMIGSVSKPITALLMLIQVQKRLISLDKTISDYIPEFNKANGSRITIRQLLSHTSGMPNYDIIPDFFPRISRKNYTREEYIKIYMDSVLLFNPGSQFFYSSWGYFTLGYIMERATGKSYSQLMKEDIFDKIGMNSSGSYFHTHVVPKRASGYDYTLGTFTSGDFRDQSNTMGTGDLYSTVEDLFKLHLAITNHTLLNKDLTNEMLKPGMKPIEYGYGWFNKNFKYTTTDSVATNFHLGMTDGFISFMLRIPSTNSLVVILCNASPTDFFGITRDLMKVLYKRPVNVKEPLQKVTERVLAARGALSAVQEYRSFKNDTAKYYVDWISMNFLVEQLTTLKRYEDARIIGELNAQEFPDRDLVFFTLGKAYEALNLKKEAIAAYERTLELFPNYEEAKNRLKALK
jgi:CubicO group peptidase (beta-lactamase class C family)